MLSRIRTTTFVSLATVTSVVLLGAQASAQDGAIDLLAAWEFNDNALTGTTVAASGGIASGTDGLLQGDAAVSEVLFLDGDGDYLQFGDNLVDLRDPMLSSFTLAAWVYTNSEVTELRRIVEHEDNFYFWAENNMFQYTTHGTGGGMGGRALSTTAPAPEEWQHMAVVYNRAGPAKMFIDGVLEGTSSTSQVPIANNTQTFQIGARRSSSGDPSNFWDGFLDDVAMWNGEISQENIDELAGVGAGGYVGRVIPTAISPVPPLPDPPDPPDPPSGATLYAHWTMDDGLVVDDVVLETAGHPDGPFDGAKTNGGPTTGVSGALGQAALFDGGPNNGDFQYINLDAHAATLGALTEGTIAAWVKPDIEDLTTDVLTIFASSDASAGSVETRFFVSNGGAFGVGNLVYGTRGADVNGETLSFGVDLLDDQWHHVAVAVDDTDQVNLYIDGEPAGSGTGGFFGDLSFVNSMAIGRNKDSTDGGGQWFYDGFIDDVRIYDKAMTAPEVAALVFGIDGDFNDDGAYDITDIDDLVGAIATTENAPQFDLNGDQIVDAADRDAWLLEAGEANIGPGAAYLPGDANLDGTVDAQDLNAMAVNWQQPIALWSGGDFNGNGSVGAEDLNDIGLNWRKSVPAAAATSAVPEPACGVLLLIGLGWFLRSQLSTKDT